jgi:hypothetical protein
LVITGYKTARIVAASVPLSLNMRNNLLDQRQFFPGTYTDEGFPLVDTHARFEIHGMNDARFAVIIDRSVSFHERHGNDLFPGLDINGFFALLLDARLNVQ